MSGRLERIWIKRARRGPMDPVETATAIEGVGLEGNADSGGRRQVTLISSERWTAVQEELGAGVDPSVRRANLLVAGIDLEESRERCLAVGDVRIRIGGETRPCNRMDEAHPGLRDALDPAWGGGAYGVVERGGELSIGQPVEWVEPPDRRG